MRLEGSDARTPVLQPLTQDRLRYELARSAQWFTLSRGRQSDAMPPQDVVKDLLADPICRLPRLDQIVRQPVFLADGSLHTTPGYHPVGHIYYVPQPGFVLPDVSERPTKEELQKARSLILDELLVDFPFTSPSEQAHAVALLVQPFVRPLITSPTPLYLIEKPTAGTGAGLLADVICFIVLGKSPAVLVLGSLANETIWTITGTLQQSPTFVLVDNVHELKSPALAAAITATEWSGRIVGTGLQAHLPVRCAWIATGNNPTLSSELARRAVRIRLDARVEDPSARTGFRHPDLREWAETHRADLVWAVLTLVRAWIAEGRPKGSATLGMFESWARAIGGILHVAEIDGFLANRERLSSRVSEDDRGWMQFFARWRERFQGREVGVSDLWDLARASEGDRIGLDLGDGVDRSKQTKLGQQLTAKRDTQLGDFRLVAGGKRQGAQLWRLEKVELKEPTA